MPHCEVSLRVRLACWAAMVLIWSGPFLLLLRGATDTLFNSNNFSGRWLGVVANGTMLLPFFVPSVGCVLLVAIAPTRRLRGLAAAAVLIVLFAVLVAIYKPDESPLLFAAVIPAWVVAVATSHEAVFYSSRYRSLEKLCVTCGYNLRGNVSGICPECGTPVPPSSNQRPQPDDKAHV